MFIIKVLVYLNRALLRCRDYYKVEKTCHFSGLGGGASCSKINAAFSEEIETLTVNVMTEEIGQTGLICPSMLVCMG